MADSNVVDDQGRTPDPNPHVECLKGIAAHKGRAKRYWNKVQRRWFTLCLDCKMERQEQVKRNPKLRGTGKNVGKQTRDVADAKWEKVAAMVGAGLPDSVIADKLAIKPSYVMNIRTERIAENQRLQEVLEDARLQRQQKVVPRALDVVEQLVDQIAERADGYTEDAVGRDGVVTVNRKPGPRDLAPALREVANIAGLTRGGEFNSFSAPDRQGAPQITVNQIIVDAKVQQAVMGQLWGWRKDLAAKKREAAALMAPIEAEVVPE